MYTSLCQMWQSDSSQEQSNPMVFWWGMKEVSSLGATPKDSWRTNTLPMPTGLAPPKHHGVFAFGADRQGALADGLHGLNPRNTAHRHTPVQNVTSVGLATGKSQVHGGTRLVDKVNKLVKRTWGLSVMNNKPGVGRIALYPPLVELWRNNV